MLKFLLLVVHFLLWCSADILLVVQIQCAPHALPAINSALQIVHMWFAEAAGWYSLPLLAPFYIPNFHVCLAKYKSSIATFFDEKFICGFVEQTQANTQKYITTSLMGLQFVERNRISTSAK